MFHRLVLSIQRHSGHIVWTLAARPQLAALLVVALYVAVRPTAQAWAQASIDIPALNDWLNTIAWFGFVPILRILGALLIIAGFGNLGGEMRGSRGTALAMMIGGGAMLLGPEIANAIYLKTTIGTTWATDGGAAP